MLANAQQLGMRRRRRGGRVPRVSPTTTEPRDERAIFKFRPAAANSVPGRIYLVATPAIHEGILTISRSLTYGRIDRQPLPVALAPAGVGLYPLSDRPGVPSLQGLRLGQTRRGKKVSADCLSGIVFIVIEHRVTEARRRLGARMDRCT